MYAWHPTCSVELLLLLTVSGLINSLIGRGYSSPEACKEK
jgi:hypothetical protein